MFEWNDIDAAKRALAACAAEYAYRATMKSIEAHTHNGHDEWMPESALDIMKEWFNEEPGSEPFRDEPNGTTANLLMWAWDLVNGEDDLAQKEYDNLRLSLKHGGKYDFEI